MAKKTSAPLSPDSLGGNQVLNDQLNETEIGAFIARNKTLSILLAIFLIAGVIVYGVYAVQKTASDHKKADQVFAYFDKNFQNFTDGKMKTASFLSGYDKIQEGLKGFAGLFPTNILIVDVLMKKKEWGVARGLLEKMGKSGDGPYQTLLMGVRLAAIYEDLNEPKKAILELERLNNLKIGVLEAKNYLDLGRLYLQMGNKEKAKINFNYVISNMAQDEFAKLAKLYLSDLN